MAAITETPVWDLFFECDKPEIMKELSSVLTRDPAGIVASYVLGKENPFGVAEWNRYFGVDVVDPPKLPPAFYAWWFGPDPVEPTKQCCETHLPPVLRPAGMSLKRLGELVQAPKEGRPSKYEYQSKAFKQNERSEAGPACWLVMRKDVFERNKAWEQQTQFIKALNSKTGAAYEEEPSGIDLATVVFARHVYTGERHLGDDTGMERRWTYSRAKEKVDGKHQLVVGGFAPGGLGVDSSCCVDDVYFGVGALRKF